MSTSSGMAHMPLQAIRFSIFSIATGLRAGEQGTIDALELAVETVCRNAITMLRSACPVLEDLVTTIGPFAILGYGAYKWIYSGLETKEYFYLKFMVDVTVPGGTELNTNVMDYMADNSTSTNTRSMTVLENHLTKASISSKGNSALMYIPKRATDGWFCFDNRWLKFAQTLQTVEQKVRDGYDIDDQPRSRTRRVIQESKEADILVSTFSLTGSVAVIQSFLEHVRKINEIEVDTDEIENVKEPTQITRLARRSPRTHPPGAYPWAKPICKAARDMSSVTMEAKAKASLLADVEKYMESRTWYHNRGIGWRRGYLLYGPPGTGKTSISTAIAGHFDLPLYIISLSDSMSDDVLGTAFDALPSQCVVLMEDIDSAGIGRDEMTQTNKDRGGRDREDTLENAITLSGLLNAIDGPVAKEGRILIMTSNTPDSLDPALIRPGRIDRKILFGYAKSEVIAKLFMHIFSDDDGEKSDPNLERLSQEFAASVPENKLTPAEIQGFLLVNREDPYEAVKLASSWASELVVTKSKGSNVAHFDGQIGMVDGGKKDERRGRGRIRSSLTGSSESGSLVSRSSSQFDGIFY